MGTRTTAAPRTRASPHTTLLCEDCGHIFLPLPADTRLRCTRCGSGRCAPMRREVAGSLVSADSPVEEGRFARVALWAGLITSEQFAECVDAQKSRAAAGHDVPSLPHLLIEKGYIRRDHATAVFRLMSTRTAEPWSNQLGQLALQRQFITQEQLRECLEAQARLILSTGSTPFLGHLLIERGYMTEAEVLTLLKVQKQRHIGILHELHAARRPARRKLAGLLRRHARVLWGAALAAGLAAVVLAGAWAHALRSAPPRRSRLGDQCRSRVHMAVHAIAEGCPRCRKGQLCSPLRCKACGSVFPLKVHVASAHEPWLDPCPRCGTLDHVALPHGLRHLRASPRPKPPRASPPNTP
jgi:predicted Zn-ribbon and HTH transcriptional regulator